MTVPAVTSPSGPAAQRPPGPSGLAAALDVARRQVRDGVLPSLAFGVADGAGVQGAFAVSGRRAQVDEDSIFFIASVSKAIVATAVMQYVDEGRWDLHAPLACYLPTFTGSGRQTVTAWHVLTHTSGLPDMHIDALRRQRPSYRRSLSFALSQVPAWEPGSRYEYSSSAWLLLAETMATLSNMPFPRALRVRLTAPLGMVDTTFDPRYARRRVVPMNGFDIRNRVTEEVLLRFLARATLPGGGMFGTVGDLLRLGRALLPVGCAPRADGGAVRILSEAAIGAMCMPQIEGIPHIAQDGTTTYVGQAIGWRTPGPGWPQRAAITHGGVSGARLWVDRDEGFAFAFLTNLWAAPESAAVAVLEEVYRARRESSSTSRPATSPAR
jgi:CubicO group peptidase (beta-lactamase class C family)